MAINQAHEQQNAVIKGDGGAIGLTEDPVALRRWMVAGPEVSRLIAGYETVSGVKDDKNDSRHHDQTMSAQKSFHQSESSRLADSKVPLVKLLIGQNQRSSSLGRLPSSEGTDRKL